MARKTHRSQVPKQLIPREFARPSMTDLRSVTVTVLTNTGSMFEGIPVITSLTEAEQLNDHFADGMPDLVTLVRADGHTAHFRSPLMVDVAVVTPTDPVQAMVTWNVEHGFAPQQGIPSSWTSAAPESAPSEQTLAEHEALIMGSTDVEEVDRG